MSRSRHGILTVLYPWGVLAALVLLSAASLPVRAQEPGATATPTLTLQQQGTAQAVATLFATSCGNQPPLNSLVLGRFGQELELFAVPERLVLGMARTQAGAGALVLLGTTPAAPFTELIYLRTGEPLDAWSLYDPNTVQPLDRRLLRAIRDEQPMPTQMGRSAQAEMEDEAFSDALIKVKRTPVDVFLRAVDREVTYGHVFRQPRQYRGEVISIPGKIRRIRVDKNPPLMARQAGVSRIYEAWLFNDEYGPNNPVCLVTTDLPEGLTVAERVRGDYPVEFVGYFFKKFRYESGSDDKPKQLRDAPLLVGYIVPKGPLRAEAPQPEWTGSLTDWSKNLLLAFLLLVAGTIVVVGGLTWWFHRGDNEVRSRVLACAPGLPDPDDQPPEPEAPPPPHSNGTIGPLAREENLPPPS